MLSPSTHIETLDARDAGVARILDGIVQVAEGMRSEYTRCAAEKNQYQMQLATLQAPNENIIAEGKQKELIAILDVLYESGYVTCPKNEFMSRMSKAFGAERLEDYTAQLSNIKAANKYPGIFNSLCETADRVRFPKQQG